MVQQKCVLFFFSLEKSLFTFHELHLIVVRYLQLARSLEDFFVIKLVERWNDQLEKLINFCSVILAHLTHPCTIKQNFESQFKQQLVMVK